MPSDFSSDSDKHSDPTVQAHNSASHVDAPAAMPTSETDVRDGIDVRNLDTIVPVDAALPKDAAGAGVPGYEMLGELGRGGMGVVYKARHLGLNRLVALKMILSGSHAAPEDVLRFLTEAEAVAAFSHPHIVQVHDVGRQRDLPYMALEFVEGGSLADKLRGGPLLASEAVRLVEQIARGMNAAHQAGIVHRDLKPANVLLTADGAPKITDFGLAKRVEGESGLTRTGAIMGTPSYMAPEQARGDGKRVGPAADVYALGAVLYECLTGRPPFRADTALETIFQVLEHEPPSLRLLRPDIPKDLEIICLKCLQKQPYQRYASAEALANDLQRWAAHEPITARPVGRLERGWRWARKRPTMVALLTVGALLALALVGLLVGSLYQTQLHDALQLAEQRRKEAESARGETQRALQLAKQHGYVHRILLAERAWYENKLNRFHTLLSECKPKHRHWEWRYLNNLSQTELLSLSGTSVVAFDPTGERLAAATEDRAIIVWEMSTGKEVLRLPPQQIPILSLVFDPKGKGLISGSGDLNRIGQPSELILWDARSGKAIHTFQGHSDAITDVAFSPDGRRFASASADNTVILWDMLTKKITSTLKKHSRMVTTVAFSPDGRQLATAGWDKKILIWDIATGKQTSSLSHHSDAVLTVAFSPDGQFLASAGWDRHIKVWNVTTKEEHFDLQGHTKEVTDLTFSPDGSQLISAGGDRKVKIWDMKTGQEVFAFQGHTQVITNVAIHPYGRLLASTGRDGKVKVWDTSSEQHARTLPGHRHWITSVAFHPQGQLASASWDRTVRLWDVYTEGETHRFLGHKGFVNKVVFSTDGQWLASASADKTIKIWDVRGRNELFTLTGHQGSVDSIAFSPDRQYLAAADVGQTLRLWHFTNSKPVAKVIQGAAKTRSVAFSPKGYHMVSGGNDGWVKVWEVAKQKEIRTLQGLQGPVVKVAVSPDGKRLAAAAAITVKIWDMSTGAEVHTMRGHSEPIWDLAFSADSKRLATASADRTVKIWDMNTGHEILTLAHRKGHVLSVAFDPQGHILASSGADNVIHLWDAPAPKTVSLAARRQRLSQSMPAWHSRKAQESEQTQNWFAASFHYGRLIANDPKNDYYHYRRGWVFTRLGRYTDARVNFKNALENRDDLHPAFQGFALAELGRWKEASQCFAKAIQQPQVANWVWIDHGLLRMQLGDRKGYQDICRDLLNRHLKTEDSAKANQVAWACALAPDAVADLKPALELAKRAVAGKPSWNNVNTLGALLYRTGQSEQALQQLHKAIELRDQKITAWDALFLAMTYHKLQQPKQARQWLDKGSHWLDEALRMPPRGQSAKHPLTWHERLELQHLRREAERLIAGTKS